MKGGKSVEVGVAGYEGITGVTLAAGLKRTTHMAVAEIAGDAFRIEAETLEKAFKHAPNCYSGRTASERFRGCRWRRRHPATVCMT